MTKKLLFKIWFVCALGLFIDGFDLYISSVAEPLFKRTLDLSPLALGATQSAALIGATLGAILTGRVTDILGRKKIIIFNFLLFVVATLLSAISWDVYSLCFFRFLVGFGVGSDYPVCAAYLSEMSPNRSRNKLMASVMFINCISSPIGVAIAYLIFAYYPHINAWRYMFAFGAIPAFIVLIMRTTLPESYAWKASQQLKDKADKNSYNFRILFDKKYLKITFALCACWFLMDISYYAIGLFIPDILTALHLSTSGDFISNTKSIVKNTLFINSFIAIGAFLSIFIVDKVSLIKLQKTGFLIAFFALFLASQKLHFYTLQTMDISVACFIIYNIFINLGPGATTYLLPAKIYPTEIKATGHGLASGSAKLGAFIGTIFLPKIEYELGIYKTVMLLSFTLLIGYFLTFLLKKKQLINVFEKTNNALEPMTINHLSYDIEQKSAM